LLPRSKNHRENAPGISTEANFEVGDIEKSMAGAEICSIGAENSAPALPGAPIGHRYRAPDDFAPVALRIAPAEQNHRENASGISSGARAVECVRDS
jgi:hypothetical protein